MDASRTQMTRPTVDRACLNLTLFKTRRRRQYRTVFGANRLSEASQARYAVLVVYASADESFTVAVRVADRHLLAAGCAHQVKLS